MVGVRPNGIGIFGEKIPLTGWSPSLFGKEKRWIKGEVEVSKPDQMSPSNPASAKSTTSTRSTLYGKSWLARLKTASPEFQRTVNRRILVSEQGGDWRTDPGSFMAESLAGNIRPVKKETLDDSAPTSTNETGKDETPKLSAVIEKKTGDVLSAIKSGLITYTPAILVICAVVLGIVIIKSAGSGGGRRK
jgi:hypothetical protein